MKTKLMKRDPHDIRKASTKTFVVPGIIKFSGRRKSRQVSFFLEAEDRQDALFQAHHGVIDISAAEFGGKAVYDLRKLKLHNY